MWTPEHGGITTADQRAQMLADQLAKGAQRTARVLELTGFDVDSAVRGYLEAKLWTSCDELFPDADNDLPPSIPGVDRRDHHERLDEYYDVDDIDGEYVESTRADIVDFITAQPLAVRIYMSKRRAHVASADMSEYFGHDFLLTRDGHGAGFWDRGLGAVGEYLSQNARVYGSSGELSDGALCSDPKGVRTFESGRLYGS
ncbi:hypothetical protein [Nocardia brasiliensis]|uniref:hypothetical protein n=1 Tax=Nocardia brasiliensis TaxID=37326 RepID=UPI001580068F|nr:hypothetical protein [Nocardia brasiliensis]